MNLVPWKLSSTPYISNTSNKSTAVSVKEYNAKWTC